MTQQELAQGDLDQISSDVYQIQNHLNTNNGSNTKGKAVENPSFSPLTPQLEMNTQQELAQGDLDRFQVMSIKIKIT